MKAQSETIFTQARVVALLTLVVCLAYANSLRTGFIGDDNIIVAENPAITKLDALPDLLTNDYWANYGGGYFRPGFSQSSGLYRPLTMVSYAINYALSGLNPIGFHVGNLILHLLDSWLLYLVAVRMGIALEASVVAAAIFAAHPVHTEAVTGVVGRAELLMAGGVLGAALGHLTRRRWLSFVSFACGMFAKEQAIMLPFILLLYDGSVFRSSSESCTRHNWVGRGLELLRAYSGYVVVIASYLALRAWVLGGFAPPPAHPVENPLIALTGLSWFLTVMKVAGLYLTLFFWPASLVADYSSNAIQVAHSLFEPAVVWGLFAWGGMVVLCAWGFMRAPRVFFSSALCLLSFLPASNVLVTIGTIMAERLFYLPSAGLCLLIGLAYERLRAVSSFTGRTPLLALRIGLIAICVALIARSVVRNHDWEDPERLYGGVVQMFPGNAKAYIWWAGALTGKGRVQEALNAYDTAMRINPEYPKRDAKFNLERSAVLFKLERFTEALEAAEQAVTLDPKWGLARNQLGLTYARLGDLDKAEAVFRYAVEVEPESADLRSSLSLILNEGGRYAEALMTADAALQRDPFHPWGLVNRGIALEGLNRREEAKAIYQQALNLKTRDAYSPALEEAKERLDAMRVQPVPAPPTCYPGVVRCK